MVVVLLERVPARELGRRSAAASSPPSRARCAVIRARPSRGRRACRRGRTARPIGAAGILAAGTPPARRPARASRGRSRRHDRRCRRACGRVRPGRRAARARARGSARTGDHGIRGRRLEVAVAAPAELGLERGDRRAAEHREQSQQVRDAGLLDRVEADLAVVVGDRRLDLLRGHARLVEQPDDAFSASADFDIFASGSAGRRSSRSP